MEPWWRHSCARGYAGVADWLYGFYRLQCPQRAAHSFVVWGERMGMEQRMVALYAGWLVAGMAFLAVRHRMRPLSLALFALLSVPMALDLGSHMVGLRDGTWWSRVGTGTLFALASAAWSLPRINAGMLRRIAHARLPAA